MILLISNESKHLVLCLIFKITAEHKSKYISTEKSLSSILFQTCR